MNTTHWRVYLVILENGREFSVMTTVEAASGHDAEIAARAVAATEGWGVVRLKARALPV